MGEPPPAATGVLPLVGAGDLAFEPLHGEPVYLHALRALVDVGVECVVLTRPDDLGRVREEARRAGHGISVVAADALEGAVDLARTLLLHDPLCPLAPTGFLLEVLRSVPPGGAAAGHRAVTDTVKVFDRGAVLDTLDRDGLVALTSPVAVAAGVLVGEPPLHDVSALVGWLRARVVVELCAAPSMARRVEDASAVRLLECLDELAHVMRRQGA